MTYFNDIEHIICEERSIDMMSLHIKTNKREVAQARQEIMYFLRKVHGKKMSWASIGGKYGKDHSTAMHAYNTIQNLIDTDKKFRLTNQTCEEKINFVVNRANVDDCMDLDTIKNHLLELINNNEAMTYNLFILYNKLTEKNEEEDGHKEQ